MPSRVSGPSTMPKQGAKLRAENPFSVLSEASGEEEAQPPNVVPPPPVVPAATGTPTNTGSKKPTGPSWADVSDSSASDEEDAQPPVAVPATAEAADTSAEKPAPSSKSSRRRRRRQRKKAAAPESGDFVVPTKSVAKAEAIAGGYPPVATASTSEPEETAEAEIALTSEEGSSRALDLCRWLNECRTDPNKKGASDLFKQLLQPGTTLILLHGGFVKKRCVKDIDILVVDQKGAPGGDRMNAIARNIGNLLPGHRFSEVEDKFYRIKKENVSHSEPCRIDSSADIEAFISDYGWDINVFRARFCYYRLSDGNRWFEITYSEEKGFCYKEQDMKRLIHLEAMKHMAHDLIGLKISGEEMKTHFESTTGWIESECSVDQRDKLVRELGDSSFTSWNVFKEQIRLEIKEVFTKETLGSAREKYIEGLYQEGIKVMQRVLEGGDIGDEVNSINRMIDKASQAHLNGDPSSIEFKNMCGLIAMIHVLQRLQQKGDCDNSPPYQRLIEAVCEHKKIEEEEAYLIVRNHIIKCELVLQREELGSISTTRKLEWLERIGAELKEMKSRVGSSPQNESVIDDVITSARMLKEECILEVIRRVLRGGDIGDEVDVIDYIINTALKIPPEVDPRSMEFNHMCDLIAMINVLQRLQQKGDCDNSSPYQRLIEAVRKHEDIEEEEAYLIVRNHIIECELVLQREGLGSISITRKLEWLERIGTELKEMKFKVGSSPHSESVIDDVITSARMLKEECILEVIRRVLRGGDIGDEVDVINYIVNTASQVPLNGNPRSMEFNHMCDLIAMINVLQRLQQKGDCDNSIPYQRLIEAVREHENITKDEACLIVRSNIILAELFLLCNTLGSMQEGTLYIQDRLEMLERIGAELKGMKSKAGAFSQSKSVIDAVIGQVAMFQIQEGIKKCNYIFQGSQCEEKGLNKLYYLSKKWVKHCLHTSDESTCLIPQDTLSLIQTSRVCVIKALQGYVNYFCEKDNANKKKINDIQLHMTLLLGKCCEIEIPIKKIEVLGIIDYHGDDEFGDDEFGFIKDMIYSGVKYKREQEEERRRAVDELLSEEDKEKKKAEKKIEKLKAEWYKNQAQQAMKIAREKLLDSTHTMPDQSNSLVDISELLKDGNIQKAREQLTENGGNVDDNADIGKFNIMLEAIDDRGKIDQERFKTIPSQDIQEELLEVSCQYARSNIIKVKVNEDDTLNYMVGLLKDIVDLSTIPLMKVKSLYAISDFHYMQARKKIHRGAGSSSWVNLNNCIDHGEKIIKTIAKHDLGSEVHEIIIGIQLQLKAANDCIELNKEKLENKRLKAETERAQAIARRRNRGGERLADQPIDVRAKALIRERVLARDKEFERQQEAMKRELRDLDTTLISVQGGFNSYLEKMPSDLESLKLTLRGG